VPKMKKRRKQPLLRLIRERCKLTRTVVERATKYVAEVTKDKSYYISQVRLWQLEMLEHQGVTGAKIAVLAMIYKVSVEEILPHFFPSLAVPGLADEALAEAKKLEEIKQQVESEGA
jgi:hypothetical protein